MMAWASGGAAGRLPDRSLCMMMPGYWQRTVRDKVGDKPRARELLQS